MCLFWVNGYLFTRKPRRVSRQGEGVEVWVRLLGLACLASRVARQVFVYGLSRPGVFGDDVPTASVAGGGDVVYFVRVHFVFFNGF